MKYWGVKGLLLLGGASLLPVGCVQKGRTDPILVRVGDYQVSRKAFKNELEKVNSEAIDLSMRDKITVVLDDLISAGLVLKLAREGGGVMDAQYKRELEFYKDLLYAKYGKIYRSGLNTSSIDEGEPAGHGPVTTTLIDYIYVPSFRKDACRDMEDRMLAGAKTEDLLQNPKLGEWSRLHLRFYSRVATYSALLPEDISDKIGDVKVGEVAIFREGTGTYIIRVTKRAPEDREPLQEMDRMLNVKMADAVERGDTMMDSYDLEREMNIDYGLYDQLNFDALPIEDLASRDTSDPVVVEFCGKQVREDQLRNEISRLPLSIQAMFRSQSLRIRATTNFILHEYAGIREALEKKRTAIIAGERQFIRDRLRTDQVSDTTGYLVNLLRQSLVDGKSGSADEILAHAAGIHPQDEAAAVPEERGPGAGGRMQDYSWILDDDQRGGSNLRLNYGVIQKMAFHPCVDAPDNDILASGGSWKLRVGDLKNELEKLTPESRIELVKGDNRVRAIYYLADHRGGIGDTEAIRINYGLIDRVDLVGNELDSMTQYKGNAVVASLYHTTLTENKIRESIAILPEDQRAIFLNRSPSRVRALRALLIAQYWQDQVDPRQLAKNEQFEEEWKKYENWLLAAAYYRERIAVEPVELNDEAIDPYLRKACALLSQQRLLQDLSKAARESHIAVNEAVFRSLGGAISFSSYKGLINKNLH